MNNVYVVMKDGHEGDIIFSIWNSAQNALKACKPGCRVYEYELDKDDPTVNSVKPTDYPSQV